MILIVIGLGIIRGDLTGGMIKFNFSMTLIKFLMSQFAESIVTYTSFGTFYLIFECIFSLFIIIAMALYLVNNYHIIKECLQQTGNQLIFANINLMIRYRNRMLLVLSGIGIFHYTL